MDEIQQGPPPDKQEMDKRDRAEAFRARVESRAKSLTEGQVVLIAAKLVDVHDTGQIVAEVVGGEGHPACYFRTNPEALVRAEDVMKRMLEKVGGRGGVQAP